MFSYHAGYVRLQGDTHEVLGLRQPVERMDADIFLDVLWNRMQRLPIIINDLRRAKDGFAYSGKIGEAMAVSLEMEKRDAQLEAFGEQYISLEMMLLDDILPLILSGRRT